MSKSTAKERHETREKVRQSVETLLAKEGEIRNFLLHVWHEVPIGVGACSSNTCAMHLDCFLQSLYEPYNF